MEDTLSLACKKPMTRLVVQKAKLTAGPARSLTQKLRSSRPSFLVFFFLATPVAAYMSLAYPQAILLHKCFSFNFLLNHVLSGFTEAQAESLTTSLVDIITSSVLSVTNSTVSKIDQVSTVGLRHKNCQCDSILIFEGVNVLMGGGGEQIEYSLRPQDSSYFLH